MTIVLPPIGGKRLVRQMAPYLLMAIVAVAMFAFGVWDFGSHRAEVQAEVPMLPPLFLSFAVLFFVLNSMSAAGFCFADRAVTIRADDEDLTVSSQGSIGHLHFRCRRDAITALYADGFWLWIHGPNRPKHILWQRLPEERYWVAGTLARLFEVRETAPLAADEIEVRVIVLDDGQIRRRPCPDSGWMLDPNELRANLRIVRSGAVLRLFQPYATRIAFHRFIGLRPSEWLIWFRQVFKLSFEVLPQDVLWVQENDCRCLKVSFAAVVAERQERLTLILWHADAGRLEQLHETLARASPVEE